MVHNPLRTMLPGLGRVFSSATVLALLASSGWVMGADVPQNIDNGLRVLLQNQQNASAKAPNRPARGISRASRDKSGRIVVNMRLNGKSSLGEVKAQLAAMGATVAAEDATYRKGVLSAWLPVNQIANAAALPGVRSASLSRKPIRNIGAATSGGVFALHTDVINSHGFDGAGITVGVLSDSYDKATEDLDGNPLAIHAAEDIASGDLPGAANPFGHTDPVNVLEDYDDGVADEGRAMLQIVHDVAPGAKLAFATAFVSEVGFATNIRRLREEANTDVICDDVFYTTEPFFSDGVIAKAVDDVVTSNVLAGKKNSFFSAAGNQQGGGYKANFNRVADATARAGLPNHNIKLDQVPGNLTAGGFHNFSPDMPADIAQKILIPSGDTWSITFQWNDPFDVGGVTTDYNILIFDANGNYLPDVSGIANNYSTDQAIEDIEVPNDGPNDAYFQIVIARADTFPPTPVAQKLQYLIIDSFGSGVGAEEFYQENAPATFGHSCAKGAIGTAAYVYDEFPSAPVAPPITPAVEDFTSQGPATIDFDASGNRLPSSEIRQKPDIASVDGGNTTFFGFDYEGDNLPNFFGTSAAAPHAAGVAALLLQETGGPNSLSPDSVRLALKSSVSPHDIDPFFARARATAKAKKGAAASVTVTGYGNSTNASSRDPNFFTVTFSPSKKGETLTAITIQLNPAGLEFDSTTATGFPFTLGKLRNITASSISWNVPTEVESIPSVTLRFAKNAFNSAASVSFGIDRDFIGDGGGNGADLLEGATIFGVTNKTSMSGTFVNTIGSGFSVIDGFGLIDAVKASDALP